MIEKVSIIIPCYNCESYLGECIESVLCQIYSNIEIILINDGSSDNTAMIIEQYAKKDPRIIPVHKKNTGVSDSRNIGLDICTGDAICFIDSDDAVKPEYIAFLVDKINTQKVDVACVSCYSDISDYDNEDVNNSNDKYYSSMCEYTSDLYSHIIPWIPGVVIWGKLFSKKVLKDFQFPAGKLCEDMWSFLRWIDNCNNIVISSKKLYFYRSAQGSISRNKSRQYALDNIQWKLLHIDYWKDRGEYELVDQIYHLQCHDIWNERKVITNDDRRNVRHIYSEARKHVLKNNNIPLKTKVKYCFILPVFL